MKGWIQCLIGFIFLCEYGYSDWIFMKFGKMLKKSCFFDIIIYNVCSIFMFS